jgi:hypothetical protein
MPREEVQLILTSNKNYYHLLTLLQLFTLWKKMGVLQLALYLNFWVAPNTSNSLYLYIVSANEQVAWVATNHIYNAIHPNTIATLSKQFIFNYYAIPL